VKWTLDEQQGSGFNHTNQIDMFLETQKIDELEQALQLYLQESKNNNVLYEWTLKLGFRPKHTNEILQKLKKNNKIKVEYLLGAKSGFHLNYQNYKNHKIKMTVQLIP
jgi:hypothetical protein